MDTEATEDLLMIGANTMWFVFAITIVVYLLSHGMQINQKVRDKVQNNETVSAMYEENAYLDVAADQKYDGQISGTEVYKEIIEHEKGYHINLELADGRMMALDTMQVSGMSLIHYSKYYSSSYLDNWIEEDHTYVKEYGMDGEGNVISVNYLRSN